MSPPRFVDSAARSSAAQATNRGGVDFQAEDCTARHQMKRRIANGSSATVIPMCWCGVVKPSKAGSGPRMTTSSNAFHVSDHELIDPGLDSEREDTLERQRASCEKSSASARDNLMVATRG
jgi:hypothetical protein